MSYKHPNVKEVLYNSVDRFNMSKYFCKSLLNLAKQSFIRKYNKKPTLDDAQSLFDEFVLEWKHYYITQPKLEKLHRQISKPVWRFGCDLKVCVKSSSREFVRSINHTFKDVFNCHYDSWIIRNNKFEEYKKFCIENKSKFPYIRPRYIDYSYLAYNGVTDDF